MSRAEKIIHHGRVGRGGGFQLRHLNYRSKSRVSYLFGLRGAFPFLMYAPDAPAIGGKKFSDRRVIDRARSIGLKWSFFEGCSFFSDNAVFSKRTLGT